MKLLSEYAPAGIKLQSSLLYFALSLGLPLLMSLFFFGEVKGQVYFQETQLEYNKILFEAPYFVEFVDGLGLFSVIPFLVAGIQCIRFHVYHYYPTSSIYVMKRLGKPSVYYKRLYTLPVLMIVLSCSLWALVLWLYYGYYLAAFPEESIPSGQWEMFCQYFFTEFPLEKAHNVVYEVST